MSSSPYEIDFRHHPILCFLYGWPALAIIVTYLVWFVTSLFRCLLSPVVHEEGMSTIDTGYLVFMLPPLALQIFAVGVYTTWIGWKFFEHN